MTVTFFGHSDAPQSIEAKLKILLIRLIEQQGACRFYVGNHGAFDHIVHSTLITLQKTHSHIQCRIVLAYLPNHQTAANDMDTIYPEGLEAVPRRFAISKRNQWMIHHSDLVVTYVQHDWGNAARYKDIAVRCGKTVIELADPL